MIVNDELFISLSTAGKVMAGLNNNDEYLNSITSNLTLYTEIEGMFRAYLTDNDLRRMNSQDFYLSGRCEISGPKAFQGSITNLNFEDATLKISKFTNRISPLSLPEGLCVEPLHRLLNGVSIAQVSSVNVRDLLTHIEETGTPFGYKNLFSFYIKGLEDISFYDFEDLEKENINTIEELTLRNEFKKLIPDEMLENEAAAFKDSINFIKNRLKKESNLDKPSPSNEKKETVDDTTTPAYWVLLGIMFDIFIKEGKYASKSHLKNVITSKYPNTRGLSERSLDTMLKKATDAFDKIQS